MEKLTDELGKVLQAEKLALSEKFIAAGFKVLWAELHENPVGASCAFGIRAEIGDRGTLRNFTKHLIESMGPEERKEFISDCIAADQSIEREEQAGENLADELGERLWAILEMHFKGNDRSKWEERQRKLNEFLKKNPGSVLR